MAVPDAEEKRSWGLAPSLLIPPRSLQRPRGTPAGATRVFAKVQDLSSSSRDSNKVALMAQKQEFTASPSHAFVTSANFQLHRLREQRSQRRPDDDYERISGLKYCLTLSVVRVMTASSGFRELSGAFSRAKHLSPTHTQRESQATTPTRGKGLAFRLCKRNSLPLKFTSLQT